MSIEKDEMMSIGKPEGLPFIDIVHHGRVENVKCISVLRVIPKRRYVFDAQWKGKPVIVKLFIDSGASKRHITSEWKKLTLLYSKQLNSPEPLFYGTTESCHWALVMEKITDADSAFQVLSSLKDQKEKKKFWEIVFTTLAEHHKKGVIQKDLQLDNFLFKDNILIPLDAYQMCFSSEEINRKGSIEQLALLACQHQTTEAHFFWALCLQYGKMREWKFTESERAFFYLKMEQYQRMRLKKRRKKYLRTNKKHQTFIDKNTFSVFDRRFIQDTDLAYFIKNIDRLMDSGEILKNGNTCYLSRFLWNNIDIVVKRYNHLGYIHSFFVTLKRSRARHCWTNAIRLSLLGIPTPEALAFIEKRKGLLIHNSYFISRYIPSAPCKDYLKNKDIEEEQKIQTVKKILNIFQHLKKFKISHGDLKYLNILVGDNGPVLIDLDSMRFHRWDRTFSKEWRKDVKRFIHNWKHSPELLDIFIKNSKMW